MLAPMKTLRRLLLTPAFTALADVSLACWMDPLRALTALLDETASILSQ